jgi:aspartyl-tRNA(Asn)/glutamyl-tRNA(Gln) amidotransferase subunit A
VNADVTSLTALELLAAYRRSELSPVEAVEAFAVRTEALEPTLNAFMTVDRDGAVDAARAAEKAWRRGEARPLEGLPFAAKDLFDTAGLRTTYGSPMFDAHTPVADARAVARAKEAGAILLGKTGTDEFAYGIAGVNPHYGGVRNPWSTNRVSGGSSSGSGAAVAARQVPLALGSDTGGSIRSPSCICGIVGLKGTWGAISSDGMWAMGRTLDHPGPMARTPADAALFHRILVEGSRGRPIAAELAGGLRPAGSGTRVGICPELDPLEPAPDIRRVFADSVAALEACGFTVRETRFADAPSLRTTFVPIRDAETLYTHRQAGLFPARRAEYSEQTYERLAAAVPVGLDEYLEASRDRAGLAEAFDRLFDDVDVLLVPLTSASAPRIDSEAPDQVAWEAMGAYMIPLNLLGVPACAVRAGFDDLGLPVGVQLVGRVGADAAVLAAAQAFYEATPVLQARRPAAV